MDFTATHPPPIEVPFPSLPPNLKTCVSLYIFKISYYFNEDSKELHAKVTVSGAYNFFHKIFKSYIFCSKIRHVKM